MPCETFTLSTGFASGLPSAPTMRTVPVCSTTYIRLSPARHAISTGLRSPDATVVSATFAFARFGPAGVVLRGAVAALVVGASLVGGGVAFGCDARLPLDPLLPHAAATNTSTTSTTGRRMARQATGEPIAGGVSTLRAR